MSSLRMVVLGSAVASASAIAGVQNTTATPHVVYTTEVVTALTTYCPAPTTLTHGTKTYTITSATTLTITDCPCTISKPVQPTGTPGGDECAKKCYDAYNQCRTKPGANMSTCASEFAACLGYNPFENGSLVTPTACSSKPAATTTGAVVPTGPAGGKGCAEKCTEAYNQCRTKPGANMSTCASEYASCLGYNPFENGSLVTPTACSSKPAATTAAPTKPAVPTQPAGGKDCAQKCTDAYNQCRGKAGANMSTCASEYASCLGYNPFENGSLVTPTACSSKPAATTAAPTKPAVPTQPAGGKDCAQKCTDAYNQCRGKAGANMSTCASEYASCLGYNPFENGSLVTPTACKAAPPAPTVTGVKPTGNSTSPPVTAGAGAMAPAKVLLALGAIALL